MGDTGTERVRETDRAREREQGRWGQRGKSERWRLRERVGETWLGRGEGVRDMDRGSRRWGQGERETDWDRRGGGDGDRMNETGSERTG